MPFFGLKRPKNDDKRIYNIGTNKYLPYQSEHFLADNYLSENHSIDLILSLQSLPILKMILK